jgi:isopentenyl-diphosphate delta-isomerase
MNDDAHPPGEPLRGARAGDPTNVRKIEHLDIVGRDREVDRRGGHFDRVHLTHRALPEIDLADVDPATTFLGKRLSFPLLISCMTGGDHDVIRTINRNLAIAAQASGVAMGVGSQRVMFTTPAARASFALREHAPDAVLLGNLGAVQLNLGMGLRECREAVDVLRADALCLHLNPLQEAVQPEGDTRFGGLAHRIGEVARALGVPVIVKEVGAGLSPADAALVAEAGVRYVDVAGSGGTSWSRIEHHRQPADGLGLAFQDWGVPTPIALRRLRPLRDRLVLIASGGIRNGIDMVKSMVLGASLCGLAAPFLAPARESADAVIGVIQRLRREFVTAMFLLGVRDVAALVGNDALLLEESMR